MDQYHGVFSSRLSNILAIRKSPFTHHCWWQAYHCTCRTFVLTCDSTCPVTTVSLLDPVSDLSRRRRSIITHYSQSICCTMLSKLVVACLSISVSALGLRLFSLAHKAEHFPLAATTAPRHGQADHPWAQTAGTPSLLAFCPFGPYRLREIGYVSLRSSFEMVSQDLALGRHQTWNIFIKGQRCMVLIKVSPITNATNKHNRPFNNHEQSSHCYCWRRSRWPHLG